MARYESLLVHLAFGTTSAARSTEFAINLDPRIMSLLRRWSVQSHRRIILSRRDALRSVARIRDHQRRRETSAMMKTQVDSKRERNSRFPRIDRSIFKAHANARLRTVGYHSRSYPWIHDVPGRPLFPRVLQQPSRRGLIRMRRASPRRGFISNAVMTQPVMARDSFLGSHCVVERRGLRRFIGAVEETPHRTATFHPASAYAQENHRKTGISSRSVCLRFSSECFLDT